MNKLVLGINDELDNIFITEDTDLIMTLNDSSEDISINLTEGICLKITIYSKNTSNRIKYTLGESSSLIVNHFGKDIGDIINFDLNNNSNLDYSLNIANYVGNYIEENINHLGNNIISKVINHCVNYTDKEFRFYVNSNILKDSNNCDSTQDNKIINLSNAKNTITPNLIVDNNLVDAHHSAYIGNFNDDIYFYLSSRGLSKDNIHKLLIDGFLIYRENIKEEDKKTIQEFFNNS